MLSDYLKDSINNCVLDLIDTVLINGVIVEDYTTSIEDRIIIVNIKILKSNFDKVTNVKIQNGQSLVFENSVYLEVIEDTEIEIRILVKGSDE